MTRILVVDDDVEMRQMLRLMLEREGYMVVEAKDGNEAIESYRNKPADLIIMDIIMPEKEGIETIMELRRDFPDVKIIAISGGGSVPPGKYVRMAEQLGAQRSFTKPFDRRELFKAIRELSEDALVS